MPKGRIPSAVDWRHAGLDATVKDQAACGSCWAFGTTGMLQGAYWMATGECAAARASWLSLPRRCVSGWNACTHAKLTAAA